MTTRWLGVTGLGVVVVAAAAATFMLTSQPSAPAAFTAPPVAAVSPTGNGAPDCQEGAALCLASELSEQYPSDPGTSLTQYAQAADADAALAVNCHAAYHVIGRAAGESSVNAWATLRSGTNDCNFGFVHGVVEGLLADITEASTAVSEVAAVCTPPQKYADDYQTLGNCVHGAGHALLRTIGSPEEALQGCLEAFNAPAATTCSEGLFMEYANDVSTYGTDTAATSLCERVPTSFEASCWSNMGPVWFSGGSLPAEAFDGCQDAGDFVADCATSVGNVYTFVMLARSSSPEDILTKCTEFSGDVAQGCFEGVSVSLTSAVAQGAAEQDLVDAAVNNVVPAQARPGVDEAIRDALRGLPSVK